jgi:hypothetical protein
VRRGRPGQRGGRPGGGRGRGGGPRPSQENVEKPRTDDRATTAEGRELPAVEPQVEQTTQPEAQGEDQVADKKQVEDPTKRDESGGKA